MAKKAKAKVAETEASKKADKTSKPKRITISSLVLAYLDKKPTAETREIYEHLVANGFPDTKFGKTHLAWYKYQVRKGNLKLPSGKTLPPATRGRKKAEAAAPATSAKASKAKAGKTAKTAKKAKKASK